MRAAAPLLRVLNVSVRYGATLALDRVTFTQDPRAVVALLGPNGAGKSSLLKAIIGLAPAATGSIQFAFRQVTDAPPEQRARQGIAYVPEGRHVFPGLTARENLEVASFASAAERGRRLDRVMALFPQLAPHLERRAWQLSGGQQQMLALGRALMTAPKLLLLDEPSLGLAPILVDQIFELLARLREQGTTILLVEQNVHRALELADRAYVLVNGRVEREGPAAELRASAEIERAYLGIGVSE
jgi:branched-chain amino acid transport system ATP-binding protein